MILSETPTAKWTIRSKIPGLHLATQGNLQCHDLPLVLASAVFCHSQRPFSAPPFMLRRCYVHLLLGSCRGPRTPIPQDRTSGACVPAEIQWPAISTRFMALLWIASRAITAVLDAQIRARATSPLEPQWMTEVATSSVAMGAPSRVRAITIKQRPKMMARVSLQAAWNLAPATIWQMQGAMTEAATFRAARARVAVSTARSGMRSWKVAWLRTQPMSTSMGALA